MMNHPADTPNAINRVTVSLLQQTFCISVEIHFHALQNNATMQIRNSTLTNY